MKIKLVSPHVSRYDFSAWEKSLDFTEILIKNKRLQVAYTHAHASKRFMVYFKQHKKMSDIEKSYSFYSAIVPVNYVFTIECFINKSCTTRKPMILPCVIYTLLGL